MEDRQPGFLHLPQVRSFQDRQVELVIILLYPSLTPEFLTIHESQENLTLFDRIEGIYL